MIWPAPLRVLEGQLVQLEPIGETHRATPEAVSREPDVWIWIDWRIPGDHAAFDAWSTFEGIFRKHMLAPPLGLRDSAYHSVVDDEWPEVRDSFAARLTRGAEAPVRA